MWTMTMNGDMSLRVISVPPVEAVQCSCHSFIHFIRKEKADKRNWCLYCV